MLCLKVANNVTNNCRVYQILFDLVTLSLQLISKEPIILMNKK